MKNLLAAALFAVALAGCGSSVKLDTVPVEDRTATPVGTGQPPAPVPIVRAPATGGSSAASQSPVAPVTLAPATPAASGPSAERLVYFDYDSVVIKPQYQALIESHAQYLRADAKRRVFVEGHTDERGGREYNLALGQKRAEAVRQALTLLGVTDAQVEAVSFGEEKPAAAGADEATFGKNRRAELAYR